MIFNINKDRLTIDTREEQLSGSINYYESIVNYSAEWDNLTIEAVLVEKDGKQGIPLAVINNKVFIDSKFDGVYYIGFVGFLSNENNEKTYQISTDLQPIRFRAGAGSIELKVKELPTLNEWERYIMQIQEFLNESKNIVDEASNINIEATKENNTAIFTITRRDGAKEEIYIYDGVDYILTDEDKQNIINEAATKAEEAVNVLLEQGLASAKQYSDTNLAAAKTYSNDNLTKAKTYSDANLVSAKQYSDEVLAAAKKYVDDEQITKTSELTNDSNFAVTNQNNNFSAAQTINGTLTINGNIVQNGKAYETHAEKLFTKNDEIITRDGATGGLAADQFSGIQAKNYDGENDGRLGFNANGEARVGDIGDEQPLLTRDEVTNLTNGQVLVWDSEHSKAVGDSNFVKNTDFANNTTAGVVKAQNVGEANHGIYISSEGYLSIKPASDTEIAQRTGGYNVITPSNMDKAIYEGLVDSKATWSEEDKKAVRTLIDALGNTDYADIDTYGLIKLGASGLTGVMLNNDGQIAIAKATDAEIDNKTNDFKAITPSNLEYAIKAALINAKTSWTDEEKEKFKNYINAIGSTDYATSSKAGVVKVNGDYGLINTDTNGNIGINYATNSDIDNKTSRRKPIVPYTLDYAVGSVKASETQSGTAKMWISTNEDGEIGLNISTEV